MSSVAAMSITFETHGAGHRTDRREGETGRPVDADIVAVEPGLQRLLLDAVAVIVEHQNLDRQLVPDQRRELGEAEHQPAVADDAGDAWPARHRAAPIAAGSA